MEWNVAIIVIIASIVAAVLIGIPVAVTLGAVSVIFIWAVAGPAVVYNAVATSFTNFWSSYSLLALPLFILMGNFLFAGGIASNLLDVASKWLQRVRGGLAMVALGTGTLFATLSGSGLAGIATIGALTGPEMLRRGYDKRLTAGAILGGGGLAHLIPPSAMAVLYAGIAEVSVGRQLMAGLVPGLVLVVLYAILISTWVRLNPRAAPVEPSVSWKVRFVSLKKIFLPMVVAVAVLGGIYTGMTTSTEAAAVGAFAAILIAVLVAKLSFKTIWATGLAAMQSTAFIMLIAVGGKLLGWCLQYYLIPQNLVSMLNSLDLNRVVVMLLIQLVYLVLGMFMDAVSIVVVTVPILLPILHALQFDLVWFGVVAFVNLEIGLVTPPVALGLYLIKEVLGEAVTLRDVLWGCLIFCIPNIAFIGIAIAFPAIVLWIPNLMIGK